MPYRRCASGVYTVSYLVLLCLRISNTFIDLSTHQVEENPGNDRLNVNGARTCESEGLLSLPSWWSFPGIIPIS